MTVEELQLQNTCFAYERSLDGKSVIVTVNNADSDAQMTLPCNNCKEYVGALSGERVSVIDGKIQVRVSGNYGEIWLPDGAEFEFKAPVKPVEIIKAPAPVKVEAVKADTVKSESVKEAFGAEGDIVAVPDKPYEEMTVEELQQAILAKMRSNGPVTEYMLGTVRENTHHGSLVNWVKSFNR
jgi:hypothetical protein